MRPTLKKLSKSTPKADLAAELVFWLSEAGYAASGKSRTYLDEDGTELIESKGYHSRTIPECVHIFTNDSAWEVALNLANLGFGDDEEARVQLLLRLIGSPKTESGKVVHQTIGRVSHYWPDLPWPERAEKFVDETPKGSRKTSEKATA